MKRGNREERGKHSRLTILSMSWMVLLSILILIMSLTTCGHGDICTCSTHVVCACEPTASMPPIDDMIYTYEDEAEIDEIATPISYYYCPDDCACEHGGSSDCDCGFCGTGYCYCLMPQPELRRSIHTPAEQAPGQAEAPPMTDNGSSWSQPQVPRPPQPPQPPQPTPPPCDSDEGCCSSSVDVVSVSLENGWLTYNGAEQEWRNAVVHNGRIYNLEYTFEPITSHAALGETNLPFRAGEYRVTVRHEPLLLSGILQEKILKVAKGLVAIECVLIALVAEYCL